jgi:stage II sporulation protein D
MLLARLSPLLLAAALIAAAPASAADRLTVRGGGWGHGIGMSQYGAYGFAKHGRDYRQILGHYYTGTTIGSTPNATVRVLLFSGASASFMGATKAAGKTTDPAKVYRAVRAAGGRVSLVSPKGKRMATVAAPLRATGKILTTSGERFRGALEFRPGVLGGIDTINAVRLETYIRGVVPRESPASWPAEALKAQALAARTYAITTSRGGTFDHYKDTRSQVYGGVAAEDARTDAAIKATRGEVVTYDGAPVVTYFFSTSGGRTENVENSFIGAEPQPWLKSVDDPYDDESPHHEWTVKMTRKRAKSLLGSLVKGSFEGIKVTQRGRSPRVVRAEVIGSGGRTATTGPVLRARLGLRDTWAYFTTATVEQTDPEPTDEQADPTGGSPGGGASVARRRVLAELRGRVLPAPRSGLVVVQRRYGKRWVDVASARAGERGRYRAGVVRTGRYRVTAGAARTPAVRVR